MPRKNFPFYRTSCSFVFGVFAPEGSCVQIMKMSKRSHARAGPLKTTSYMLRDGLRIVFRRISSGTLHHFVEKRFLNFLIFSFTTAVTEFSPPGAAGCPRRPSSVPSLGELPDFSFEA